MQLQTYLVRRQSRFYFRSRVPADLKSHYGRNEILVSLNTSDKRIADYELAKFKMKLYAEFAQIRGENFGIELKPSNETSSQDQATPTVPDCASTPSNSVLNSADGGSTVSDCASTPANSVSDGANGASIVPINAGPKVKAY